MVQQATIPAMQVQKSGFAGWRMLAIAFLAQNCAIGLNFGLYGTLVETIQTQFSTTRALASSGLAVMTLFMGLLSPLVGSLIRLASLRTIMIAGTMCNAAGYAALALADSILVLLAIYGLILGPGAAMLGVVPSSTLVSNWFVHGKGRALGLVNAPFFVFLFPMLAAALLGWRGLDAVFLLGAAIFLILLPLLFLVVDRPEDIGQRPLETAEAAAEPPAPTAGQSVNPWRQPAFVVAGLAVGTLTAGGLTIATHLVPMALEKQLALQPASVLLSAFGIAGALGALLFGWLADRIGGPRAMAVLALAWIPPWIALLMAGPNFPELLVIAILIGTMSGGIVGLGGVILNEWLGRAAFGRALGHLYLFKVPFLFGAAPFAGYLFDRTGSYRLALSIHIASFLAVALMLLLYRPTRRG